MACPTRNNTSKPCGNSSDERRRPRPCRLARLPRHFLQNGRGAGRSRSAHRHRGERQRRLVQAGQFQEALARAHGQCRHCRADRGGRRRRPRQWRQDPLRFGRRLLPHRAGDGADQGRCRLYQCQREADRPVERHRLWRARPHPPFHRGHGLAAAAQQSHPHSAVRSVGNRTGDPRRRCPRWSGVHPGEPHAGARPQALQREVRDRQGRDAA